MKVLFVSSGNSKTSEISPIVKAQGRSLEKAGVNVKFYPIRGKGVWGYLNNVKPLKKYVSDEGYDLVHAHYSLCGIVSRFSTSLPIVVSLMGSDVNSSSMWRAAIKIFARKKWAATIVKSDDMKAKLGINSVSVIPNGVDLEQFKELSMVECRSKLGLDEGNKVVLFGANPIRPVKNYVFFEEALSFLTAQTPQLMTLGSVPHSKVATYINAADVLVLCSKWEGSPNVIKEAMACNCPIVSTDVGDVKWLLGGVEGHYIADNNPKDFAEKIEQALEFGKRTKGRERLMALGLDSETIARKLVDVYQKVLEV